MLYGEGNLHHHVDANLASSCKVAIEFQDAQNDGAQSETMSMNLGSAISNEYQANSSQNQANSIQISEVPLQYSVSSAAYAEASFANSPTNQHSNSHSGQPNTRIPHVQINSQPPNDAYPQNQSNYFDLNFLLPDAQYGLSNGSVHQQPTGANPGDVRQPNSVQPPVHHLQHSSSSNLQLNSNLTAAYVQYSADRGCALDSPSVYSADNKSQLSAVLNSSETAALRATFLPNGQPASSQMSPPASPERLQQLQQFQRQQQLQQHLSQSNHFTNVIPAHLPAEHRTSNGLTSHVTEYATYGQTTNDVCPSSHPTSATPNSSTLVALLRQKVKTIPPNQCFSLTNTVDLINAPNPTPQSAAGHPLSNQPTALSNQPLKPVLNQSNGLMIQPYSSLRPSANAPAAASHQQATSAFLSTAHHKLVTPPSSPNLAELLAVKQTGMSTSIICQARQTSLNARNVMPPSYVLNVPSASVPLQTNNFSNNVNHKTVDSTNKTSKPSKRSKAVNKKPIDKVLKPKPQRIKKLNNCAKQIKAKHHLSLDNSRMNQTSVALVPQANSGTIKNLDQNNNSVQSNNENSFLLNNNLEPSQSITNFGDNSDTLSNNSSSLGSNSLDANSLPKTSESISDAPNKNGKTTSNRKKITQHFCSYSNCKKVYSKSSHLKGRIYLFNRFYWILSN